MSTYIEYELDDGVTILVMQPTKGNGSFLAGNEDTLNKLTSEKNFGTALEGVRRAGLQLRERLKDLEADETEVSFGLVTTGKVGNFAVAEVGVEANFTVTLKWKKQPPANVVK